MRKAGCAAEAARVGFKKGNKSTEAARVGFKKGNKSTERETCLGRQRADFR